MASVIASIAAVCVMTGGIGYQTAVSGAQTDTDSIENTAFHRVEWQSFLKIPIGTPRVIPLSKAYAAVV